MFFYWLTKLIFKVFAQVFFQLKVEGQENLPKKEGFILAANHASSLDPFLIIAAVPRYIRWVIIYEYYDQRLFHRLLRRMHFIRVENNLPKEAFRALLQQEVVGIFPEGRRSWDGQLGPAKRGVATLARRAAAAVVPVAVVGSFAALPRTRKLLKPHLVSVRIGKPLFFSGPVAKEESERVDEENTQRVMQAIVALLRG